MNELVERWKLERAWLQEMLESYQTGTIQIGNPWEGRTPSKIADLRRKIGNLDQLIETENNRGTQRPEETL